jgi:6-phosphogluconolactonase
MLRAMAEGNKTVRVVAVLLLAAGLLGGLPGLRTRIKAAGRKPQPAPGLLFAMTNQLVGNQVFTYTRNSDGTLAFLNATSAQGNGTGSDLNSQGALLYLPSSNFLYVVNPRSGNISGFSVAPTGLTFINSIGRGQTFPISLTAFGTTLYALYGKAQNIQGYTINANGTLTAIADATGTLSGGNNLAPSEVAFTPSGTQIVVTEKGGNHIDVFPVNSDGTVGTATINASNGLGPSGFAFDANGFLDVAEAGQTSTSSYQVNSDGTLTTVSNSVQAPGREPLHVSKAPRYRRRWLL